MIRNNMPLRPRDFADKCIASNTDEHIIGLFTHNRVRVYHDKKMVHIRDYILRATAGDPPEPGLIAFLNGDPAICDDADCYNPRHLRWVTTGYAAKSSMERMEKRTLVATDDDVITGLWVYSSGIGSPIVERDDLGE